MFLISPIRYGCCNADLDLVVHQNVAAAATTEAYSQYSASANIYAGGSINLTYSTINVQNDVIMRGIRNRQHRKHEAQPKESTSSKDAKDMDLGWAGPGWAVRLL